MSSSSSDENKNETQKIPTVVTPSQSRRFHLNNNEREKKDFLAHLDTHGYAVVASVANPAQIDHAKDLFWTFLEGRDRDKVHPYQVRRDDPTTWEMDKGWIANGATGIISTSGVGQASFMWYLRLLPGVSQAFATIWGTSEDDLLCSFDGGNVFRPWRYNPKWRTKGGWFHLDQNAYNPGKADRCCVQGLVTLTKVDEDSGGLTVIPGSHKDFLDVCERNAEKPRDNVNMSKYMIQQVTPPDGKASAPRLMDYVPIGENDEIRLKSSCLICAEPGDLIVWDSRLVHCNSPALRKSTNEIPISTNNNKTQSMIQKAPYQCDLLRMVGYICMTPASWASDDALRKRWEAFVNNVSTSHWPHHFIGGTKGPYDMPKNDPSTLTQQQQRLIGGWIEPQECLNVQSEYTKDQIEARRILELAEEAEGSGDCLGAIKLYRRAYKLDPTLEFPDD